MFYRGNLDCFSNREYSTFELYILSSSNKQFIAFAGFQIVQLRNKKLFPFYKILLYLVIKIFSIHKYRLGLFILNIKGDRFFFLNKLHLSHWYTRKKSSCMVSTMRRYAIVKFEKCQSALKKCQSALQNSSLPIIYTVGWVPLYTVQCTVLEAEVRL